MGTVNIYDVAVMTRIVLEHFSDEEMQDRSDTLFIWPGTVMNPSQNNLETTFETYRTVSASFENANAALREQLMPHFQMSFSPVTRSHLIGTQSYLELQTKTPTIAGSEIPVRK